MFPNRAFTKSATLLCLLLFITTSYASEKSEFYSKISARPWDFVKLSLSANDISYHGRVSIASDVLSVVILAPSDIKLPLISYSESGNLGITLGIYPDHTKDDLFKSPSLSTWTSIKNYHVYIITKDVEFYINDYETMYETMTSENNYDFADSIFDDMASHIDEIDYETLGLEKNYDSLDSLRADMESKIGAYLEKKTSTLEKNNQTSKKNRSCKLKMRTPRRKYCKMGETCRAAFRPVRGSAY